MANNTRPISPSGSAHSHSSRRLNRPATDDSKMAICKNHRQPHWLTMTLGVVTLGFQLVGGALDVFFFSASYFLILAL